MIGHSVENPTNKKVIYSHEDTEKKQEKKEND